MGEKMWGTLKYTSHFETVVYVFFKKKKKIFNSPKVLHTKNK